MTVEQASFVVSVASVLALGAMRIGLALRVMWLRRDGLVLSQERRSTAAYAAGDALGIEESIPRPTNNTSTHIIRTKHQMDLCC